MSAMMSLTMLMKRAALASIALLMAGIIAVASGGLSAAEAASSGKLYVNRVAFEGNRKAKDEQLQQVVTTRPRTVYDPAAVAADVERLKDVYSRSVGRAQAQITVRTVPVSANTVDVVFTVAEGDKVGIEEIVFVGNNAFSAWRLKRQIATLESGFLGWFRTTDVYDPERVASDSQALTRFYAKRGYPDFRVVSAVPTLNAAGNAYILTFTVEEGERYTFGDASVESKIAEVNADDLRSSIRTAPGQTYNAEEVDKTIEAMTDNLSRRGLAFAQVRPRAQRDGSGHVVGVVYVIEDGARVYIERINVSGNTRTRDYVIRREFDTSEGDAYNQVLIDRAARRLRNLGYFDSVKITTSPGSTPDRVVVNVEVVDQSTGEFSIGGGYSTTDGFIGEVSLAERNFLGRGQYVKVSGKWGQKSTGLGLSFTEPYFMGERIAAGFDIYANTSDATSYSYYSTAQTGGTLRATFPITENLSIGVRYSAYVQDVKITNSDYNDCTAVNQPACLNNGEASTAIKEILGSRFVSMIGYSVTYSTIDDVRQPSSGWYAQLNQDFAGIGGDAQFIKTTAQGRYYYPITDDLTAMFKLQGGNVMGWGGEKLLVSDQFNIGPDLVRGFAPGGIGPRDLAGGGKGNALGGSLYYGGTVELQFPILGIPRELGLRGALFADAGTLYDYAGRTDFSSLGIYPSTISVSDSSKIRSSVGASLLWASPLGPIRFDYAYVLSKEKYDQEQAFRFSGGGSF